MSVTLAQEVLDGVYEDLAETARFIPKVGDEADCLILPDQGDGAYALNGFDVTAARNVYLLRRSEIPALISGDRFRYPKTDGPLYTVSAAPRLLDDYKLEWTLELTEITEEPAP